MAHKMIYDFKKLLQEPETNAEPHQKRALKQNFKALNKNFDATAIWRQLNLLYVAAMRIVGSAEGNEIDFENSKGEGGFTFLHYAVWANATGLVKTFLQHDGIDVNAQSYGGLTSLQLAIIQNSPKILKIFLSHPEIDLNLACLDGWTALHLAVCYDHEELIAEILKYKSKLQIDARIRQQITPLQLAALLDKRNLVKILLESGADARLTTETGETALKLAEKFKCQNAVEVLRMHAAANILLENSTPEAATCQIAPVTDQLNAFALENQPTINETETSQHLTPIVSKPPPPIYDFSADGFNDAATLQLFRVTFEGKIDEMKSLLAKGNINLEAVHKSGKNIWDFAILNDDPAVVECLLEVENHKMDLTDLLFNAAKMGSPTIVKYFIEVKNLKLHRRNVQNQPLLIAATLGGSLELVCYLIEVQCANLNEKCEDKVAFDYAAIEGNLKIMLYLVKKHDFKFDSNIGGTHLSILFQFVRIGSLENIKYLIEVEKLSFNDKKGPWNGTILHEAALNKNLDVIKYFIEQHGLNVMDRDDRGYVPLFCAVESNNLAVVKYFMEDQNLSIHLKDKKNRTALHIAAMNGHLETVRYLVEEKKFNVNAKDNYETIPLLLSAYGLVHGNFTRSGHVDVMKYLQKMVHGSLHLEQLYDYICIEKYGKNSSGEFTDKEKLLFGAARDGNLAVIKFLIEEFGVDANMKGGKYRTALHIAAMNGHMEIARYLVEENEVNVHARDEDKATPLQLSFKSPEYTTANSGHVKVMKYLWKIVNGSLNVDQLVKYIWVEKYGRYSATDKNRLLIDASEHGNLTLIKFLIEDVGMYANVKDRFGRIPIFLAVAGYKLEAVKYFVEYAKVDLHVRNSINWTVRQFARNYYRQTIESYLASKGAPL